MAWSTPPGLKIVEMEAELAQCQKDLTECKQLREAEAQLHAHDSTTIASLKRQLIMLEKSLKGGEYSRVGTEVQSTYLENISQVPMVPKETHKFSFNDLEKQLVGSIQKQKDLEEGRKKDTMVIQGLKEMIDSFERNQVRHEDVLKERDDRITDLEIKLLHSEQKIRVNRFSGGAYEQGTHAGGMKDIFWEDQIGNEQIIRDLRNDQTTYETSIKNLLEEIERLKKDRVGGYDVGNAMSGNDIDKDAKLKALKKELAESKEESRLHKARCQIADGEMNGLKRHVQILEARMAQSPTSPSVDDFDRIRAEHGVLAKDRDRWRELYLSYRALNSQNEENEQGVHKPIAFQSKATKAAGTVEIARTLEAAKTVKTEKAYETSHEMQAQLRDCQSHGKDESDQIKLLKERLQAQDEALNAASQGAKKVELELKTYREYKSKAEEQIKKLEGHILELDKKLDATKDAERKLEGYQRETKVAEEETKRLKDQINSLENKLEAAFEGAGYLELELEESQATNTAQEVRRLGLRVKELEAVSPMVATNALMKSHEADIQQLEVQLRHYQEHTKRYDELLNQTKYQEKQLATLRRQLEEQQDTGQRSMTANPEDRWADHEKNIKRLNVDNAGPEKANHEPPGEIADLNSLLENLAGDSNSGARSEPEIDEGDEVTTEVPEQHDKKTIEDNGYANAKQLEDSIVVSTESLSIPVLQGFSNRPSLGITAACRKHKRHTNAMREKERRQALQEKDAAEEKKRQHNNDRENRLRNREEKKRSNEKREIERRINMKRRNDEYDEKEDGNEDPCPKRLKM